VPESPAEPPSAAAEADRLRIVVVDDNRDAVESLAMLLECDGHMTRVATDGPSGVEQIASFRPDAALVDIGLPGFDGYEVARRVRGAPGGADILLVAITGWGQESDKQLAQAAGFDHHITKPLAYDKLADLLLQFARTGSSASTRQSSLR
jgi:CheY-like chemotaxis protein